MCLMLYAKHVAAMKALDVRHSHVKSTYIVFSAHHLRSGFDIMLAVIVDTLVL